MNEWFRVTGGIGGTTRDGTRVWVDITVTAPTRAEAERKYNKIKKAADRAMGKVRKPGEG